VRSSQQILLPATVQAHPDEKINCFKGLSLLSAAIGLRNNPSKAMLRAVLPADTYAEWQAAKKIYLPKHSRVERWRPVFAAERLRTKAFASNGLHEGGLIWNVVSKIAERNEIETMIPTLHFSFPTTDMKQTLMAFKSERLDDVACLETTLDLVSAISDREHMHARAMAWATADLPALSTIASLPDAHRVCGAALAGSVVAQDFMPDDIGAQLDTIWMQHAEKSLAENASTFAILPLSQLTNQDGYLEKLRQKGYAIEEPNR
jgi:hypothetical protein